MLRGTEMATTLPDQQLRGRQREREALDRLLHAARGGDGGALLVHGEPGVGKTALLDYAVEAGSGGRGARPAGAGGEGGLRLCAAPPRRSPVSEGRGAPP